MTLAWWTTYWWWWLLFVGISWFIMEIASIVAAHIAGQKVIQTWTLSDTIRRWSSARRWLAPVVVGIVAMLVWHFFIEQNVPSA